MGLKTEINNAVHTRRVAFLRQVSVPSLEAKAPPLTHRWLHTSGNGKEWSAFGATDSRALESAFQHIQHDEELRQAIEEATRDRQQQQQEKDSEKEKENNKDKDNDDKGKDKNKDKDKDKNKNKESADTEATPEEFTLDPPDPFTALPPWRVPVGEDHLYEVDLRTQKLYPVFWKQGKGSKVMRATWFTESSSLSPIAGELAEELEGYYHELQPWLPSYADELRSAVTIGADAEDKLKRPLKNANGYVIMLGPHLARIYTQDLTTRLAKSVLTAWVGEHSGGQLVIRGFETAKKSLQANVDDSKNNNKDLKRKQSKGSISQRSPTASGSSTPARARSVHSGDGTGTPSSTKSTETSASLELLRSITAKLGPLPTRSSGESSSPTPKEREAALSGMLSSGLEDRAKGKRGDRGEDESSGKDDANEDSTQEPGTQGAEMAEGNEDEEFAREEEQAQQPVDLVLILHGIGQKYAAETNPSLDFTIAVNNFRELVHKQAAAAPPATVGGGGFPQMLKGRRVQFLPVMWRAALEDFEPEPAHEPKEELNNHFTLDEVFGDRNSIPIVRKLISGVLLDIPLYLSRHRSEIIRRVIREANRMYRLFCQRNPKFEAQDGRVHWIAHSLGAALAFDILSSQPTYVPELGQIPGDNNHLHFNVHTLILAGSPAALFIWLAKSQLIARKGRKGSDGQGGDCVDRHEEYFGCLAVDRIANIFSLSDPVGTRLTPCVASEYALGLQNISLTQATTAILRSLPGGLDTPMPNNSGFFSSWGRSAGANKGTSANGGGNSSRRSSTDETADMAEELFGSSKEQGKKRDAAAEDRSASWFLRLSNRRGNNNASQKRPSSAGSNSTVGPDDWERVRRNSAAATDSARPKMYDAAVGNEQDGDDDDDDDDADGTKSAGRERKTSLDSLKAAASQRPKLSEAERERGRRRVYALNQLGTLDFTIPIASSLLSNQYLDMLYSHASYWQLPSFADAVLAFIFASDETLAAARGHLFK
ncbi:hypothetical protein OC844_007170 [Tilletia horrida]|nr:hypothetical protein OC844_007170 [Tilletia horrida]